MMQTYPCRRRAMWAQQAQPLTMGLVIPTTGESHEQKDEARDNANEKNADEAVQVNPHLCPKCGKEVRRGMYFHQKYCKG